MGNNVQILRNTFSTICTVFSNADQLGEQGLVARWDATERASETAHMDFVKQPYGGNMLHNSTEPTSLLRVSQPNL